MGNKTSEPCGLTGDEIEAFVSKTHFSREEVKALWFHFRSISGENGDPDHITQSNFQAALSFRDSQLLDRMFNVFDTNADGSISFSEFLACLSIISNKASHDEKLDLSFRIYDADGDGLISVSELTTMLLFVIREHDLVISSEEIDEIVEVTFKEADVKIPGMIDFSEFRVICTKTPYVLSHLTLNITSIIQEYSDENEIDFKTPRVSP
jgi:serine/threonine-protein phosphatase 2B regulatory subunit